MLRRRLMLASSLSGVGVPADATGNLGDRYFDTTAGRWYIKRWVANREGGDVLSFPVNAFLSAGDFDFSVCLRSDSALLVSKLFTSTPTADRSLSIYYNEAGSFGTTIFKNDGTGFSSVFGGASMSPGQGIWYRITVRRSGLVTTIFLNDVEKGSSTPAAGWDPSTTQTGCALLAPNGTNNPFKACNIKFTGPGASIIAPLDDGTGTVIKNQAGVNGVLTDGSPTNFWAQSWVPMDLL